jgi:DNA-binding PadR family transcriptional regulator
VDFQQNLGIARNILCDRLARLLENGVLIKQDVGEHGTRYEYRLTDKGRDLFTVITALRQWSDRWNGESDGPELVDRANGEPVRTVAVQSRDGRTLDVRAVVYRDSSDTDSAAG